MSLLFILLGFTLLVIGGEFLVRASVGLSFKLQLSKMVIGLTVVSFATSLPELIVSLQGALKGYPDIALGNVVGSNIANIGLVLGITALIFPLQIDRDFYKFNWPVMMLFSVALYVFLHGDGQLSQREGVALLIALCVFLVVLIRRSRKSGEAAAEEVDPKLTGTSYFKITVWLLIGGAALWGGSELLVDGAVDVAERLGVSQRVIAVSMIAVGTSVPELAASVIAALKQEKAISLGNLIGSNIFNIGSVLGLTALIKPVSMESPELLSFDLIWMLAFAAILIPLAFLPKRFVLGRGKGLLIFAAYAVFIVMTFLK